MAQGEFSVERQLWSRWPKVVKVIRTTESGREERRYVRKGADWEAKDYAVRKVAELQAENDKLRELVRDMWPHVRHRSRMCRECELPCDTSDECLLYEPMRQRMAELGIEADA